MPSEAVWDHVVPEWARGRRDAIVRRLIEDSTHHRVESTDDYAWSVGVTR